MRSEPCRRGGDQNPPHHGTWPSRQLGTFRHRPRLGGSSFESREKIGRFPRAVVTDPVDEERRRAVDAAPNARPDVLANTLDVRLGGELARETLAVEVDRLRVSDKIRVFERVLVLEEHAMHLPEPA